jgi:homocysteine S-methyltransferase
MTERDNLVQKFLDAKGYMLLDGGLASELEHAGHDLADALWSARLLLDSPQAIAEVHRKYLEAGADCCITASYQATIEGFINVGASEEEAIAAIKRSVEIAIEVRDDFWSGQGSRGLRPLVAASVGPYGAYLANGAEFTGDYDLDTEQLVEFHRPRWEILAKTGADLLACETIPSLPEARALARLLSMTPGRSAWFSFSCKDQRHICDGTPIATCVEELAEVPGLLAVGVNCTSPKYLVGLIEEIRRSAKVPIVVYPNLGETWNAEAKVWEGREDRFSFARASRTWFDAGAKLIGGCCRTRPADIRRSGETLAARGSADSAGVEV